MPKGKLPKSGESQWPCVGAWRLVSYESHDQRGTRHYPLGRDATGMLWYDADGNMSALLARTSVEPFESPDLRGGTDAEVRAAFEGFIGYFGTYRFDLAAGTVTHTVQGASFPNWMGGEQVRNFRVEGQRLVLSTPPITIGGRQVTSVLVWERANAA